MANRYLINTRGAYDFPFQIIDRGRSRSTAGGRLYQIRGFRWTGNTGGMHEHTYRIPLDATAEIERLAAMADDPASHICAADVADAIYAAA